VTTSTTSKDDLLERAERWASEDPDPEAQKEIRDLVARGARAELLDRFAGTLEFGTAGLRGVIGAGPNRMNRAVVARTTFGLAEELLASVPDAKTRGVVVARDGRRMSRELAEDTAAILAAHGIKAFLFAEPIPTPLAAFAVTRLGASAGVMVTASHNPPEYNGYKVYWGNGAQIIPPVDTNIAARIEKAPPANRVERPSVDAMRAKGLVIDVPATLEREYLDAVRAAAVHPSEGDRAITIVYTPMHGVGDKLTRAALAEAGFTRVFSVPEQQYPDGAFPTVAFPNPEEKGAMDLAFALARREKADLVLANDPDADRLAVAVPSASSPTGYVQLTGNQVGVLLGHYLLTERPAPNTATDKRLVIASIVSSPLLGHIARALGVRYEETLTGFKWIANRAMELEKSDGYEFVFGYEEALGYTVGDIVRDKDGVSAAALMAEIAAVLRARGSSVLGALDAIHRQYGLFVSSQVNVTRKGPSGVAEIRAIMDALRASPPRRVGAHDVVAICDYASQTRTVLGTGEREALTLPKSNVLAFELAGGSRLIARPSGTEPKAKFYVDVREPVLDGEQIDAALARANGAMRQLADSFVEIAGVRA
jgi:phosphomannomutase